MGLSGHLALRICVFFFGGVGIMGINGTSQYSAHLFPLLNVTCHFQSDSQRL